MPKIANKKVYFDNSAAHYRVCHSVLFHKLGQDEYFY